MNIHAPLLSALVALFAALATSAQAQSDGRALDLDAVSDVRLAYGWQRDDGAYVAAVVVDLAPGWKTYWRWAGSNGIPPSFDWRGSGNVESVQYLWPAPQIFNVAGVRTIGFETQLVLPVVITPKEQATEVRLDLAMDYGVCADICIPARDEARLDLGSAGPERDLIELSLIARPQNGGAFGLQAATCAISPNDNGFEIEADLTFAKPIGTLNALMIEAGNEQTWISEPDVVADETAVRAQADLFYFGDGPFLLDRSAMRFTLLTSAGTIEFSGCQARG